MRKDLYSLQEAESYLAPGPTRATLRRWCEAGDIPGILIDKGSRRAWMIARPDLDDIRAKTAARSKVDGLQYGPVYEQWLADMASGVHTGAVQSPATIREYKYAIARFWSYSGHKPGIEAINADVLREVYRAMPAHQTAQKLQIYKALKSFFKHLIGRGMKTDADVTALRPLRPKPNKTPRFTMLQGDDFMSLLTVNETWINGRGAYEMELTKTVVMLGGYAGLRNMEIRELLTGDVDLAGGWLHVGREMGQAKGNKYRRIPIETALETQIRAWLAIRPRSPYKNLLIQPTGLPLRKTAVNNRITSLAKKASESLKKAVEITPHGLRHTAASRWEQMGFTLTEIQELLGHADISSTKIYTHGNLGKVFARLRGEDGPASAEKVRVQNPGNFDF